MLVEVTHISTIIAQGPVKALRMTRERMRELMEDEPALVEHFSAHIFGRLDAVSPKISTPWIRLSQEQLRIPPPPPSLGSAANSHVVH